MEYAISIIVRLLWSLTIGLPFFLIGFLLFLILDIFFPKEDWGFNVLTRLFQWGSCDWFKGIRFRTRGTMMYKTTKETPSYVILDNGFCGLADEAEKKIDLW